MVRSKFRHFEDRNAWGLVASLVICWQVVNPGFINAQALQTVNMAIPSKSFQMVIYPVAVQQQGSHERRGIDLRSYLHRADDEHSGHAGRRCSVYRRGNERPRKYRQS